MLLDEGRRVQHMAHVNFAPREAQFREVPPPACESHSFVRAKVNVVSIAFGTKSDFALYKPLPLVKVGVVPIKFRDFSVALARGQHTGMELSKLQWTRMELRWQ